MTITPHKQHNHNSTVFLLLWYFYFYSFTGLFFLFAYSWTFYVQLLFLNVLNKFDLSRMLSAPLSLSDAQVYVAKWVKCSHIGKLRNVPLSKFFWETKAVLFWNRAESADWSKSLWGYVVIVQTDRVVRRGEVVQGPGRGPGPGLENWQHIKEELIVGAAASWPLLHPPPLFAPSQCTHRYGFPIFFSQPIM